MQTHRTHSRDEAAFIEHQKENTFNDFQIKQHRFERTADEDGVILVRLFIHRHI